MTGTCGENLTWHFDGGTLTISGNGDMSGCKKIPWQSELIREVVIERDVTSIGYEAFSDCTRLTSVTIPDGVKEIGGCAFSYCGNLRTIYYPAGRRFEEILSASNGVEIIAY